MYSIGLRSRMHYLSIVAVSPYSSAVFPVPFPILVLTRQPNNSQYAQSSSVVDYNKRSSTNMGSLMCMCGVVVWRVFLPLKYEIDDSVTVTVVLAEVDKLCASSCFIDGVIISKTILTSLYRLP